jgi:hypothetical protein
VLDAPTSRARAHLEPQLSVGAAVVAAHQPQARALDASWAPAAAARSLLSRVAEYHQDSDADGREGANYHQRAPDVRDPGARPKLSEKLPDREERHANEPFARLLAYPLAVAALTMR